MQPYLNGRPPVMGPERDQKQIVLMWRVRKTYDGTTTIPCVLIGIRYFTQWFFPGLTRLNSEGARLNR